MMDLQRSLIHMALELKKTGEWCLALRGSCIVMLLSFFHAVLYISQPIER